MDERAAVVSAGQSLIFRAGNHLCALPLRYVIEVMRAMPVESLTGVAPFVSGVCLIRGVPLPVVDVAMLVSGQRSPPSRLVTIRPEQRTGQRIEGSARADSGERAVALAVGEVLGVRAIPAELAGLAPLLRGAGSEVTVALGTLDPQMLVVLGNLSVVSQVAWQSLAEREVRR